MFSLWPRPHLRNQQPKSITTAQKDSQRPRKSLEFVIGNQERGKSRNMPEKSSPSISTGHRLRHLYPSGTGTPHDGKRYSGVHSPGDPPHTFLSTSSQPSTISVEHEIPKPQFTPTVFPQITSRERATKLVPDDIIDLTMDSSDVEFLDTPDQGPSTRVSENSQSALVNPGTLPERPFHNPFTHKFSTGSAIRGPTSNPVKKYRDKLRLFLRYTVDFETRLASISAHGLISQISMLPQW